MSMDDRRKAYRERNRERIRERERKYYAANRDRILESQRAYVERNREKIKDSNRDRAQLERVTNPEAQLARERRYAEKHNERRLESSRKYKAKERAKDPEAYLKRVRELRRAWSLRLRGVTPEQWEAMFESQGRACGICPATTPTKDRFWALDHNHATGKVRGILCMHCNVGIGQFKDDPQRLRRAADYLERTGWRP